MHYQLKTRQICLFFIAFLPVNKFFIMPSIIAQTCNEDMWISALMSTILDIITVISVLFVCRKAKTDLFTLLELNFGKIGKIIILSLYFILFMTKAIIPINEQKEYTLLTLYEALPSSIYFLPFFLVAFYVCIQRARVIGRCSDLFWAITVISLVLVFGLSVYHSDFTTLLPIGANGIKNISVGAYYSSVWFGDCVYLMFFVGEFAYKKFDMLKISASYAISSAIVILLMMIFYGVFTSLAGRQNFALTEVSKYATVINNIGRFDYFGIFGVLLSNTIAVSLPIFFATKILAELIKFKYSWIPALITVGALFLFTIIFDEYFASIENFIINYASGFFILMCNVFPILTVFLKTDKTSKKEKHHALYQD